MNSYHFMNFPASPRSWPVRPPSWASASRGCHLGGFYHGIGGFSQGFSHDFPRCVQDLWRKSSEIWSDFGSDAGFCWTVRNCRFGSFGSCWDGFWHSLEHSFHDCFFRPRTRLFWAWSRRCLNLFNLFNHDFLLKDVEPPLMLQLQHIQTKLYCCWYQHFFLASSFHEHLGSICQCLQTHPHSNWTQLVIFPTEYDHQHSSKSQLLMDNLQFSCLGSISVFHEYSAIKYSLYPH